MAVTASLRDIVFALEDFSDLSNSFLDLETGKVEIVSKEFLRDAEEWDEEDDAEKLVPVQLPEIPDDGRAPGSNLPAILADYQLIEIAGRVIDGDGAPVIDADGIPDYSALMGNIKSLAVTNFDKNRQYLWPIPANERRVNPNLTQNSGY